MTTVTIGYARCSTDKQDLATQKAALEELGVLPDRIYTDHGLTGSNRDRPRLEQAHETGDYSISDLAEVFTVSRPTVYRTLARQSPAA
jgi:hypothetical protein